MDITGEMVSIEAIMPWEDIEAGIRQTPLLNQGIYPYAEAAITLKRLSYNEVRPTSLYIAKNLLLVQKQIAEDIAPYGHDPLEMNYGLLLNSTDEQGESITTGFIPPIVEETEDEGRYILDGSHRTNRGLRWLGRKDFLAIHITGIRSDCPAYADPNEWREVEEYEVPPREPHLRKRYRQDVNIYNLYRDFSRLNRSRPRYGDQVTNKGNH